jgi:putative hydrolase of the HAD superfamily
LLATELREAAARAHRQGTELAIAGWLSARVDRSGVLGLQALEDLLWKTVVTLAPVDGARDVLARVVAKGVRVGAVSNAPFSARVLRAELAKHELDRYLGFVVSSADHGLRKPNVDVFRASAEGLGLRESGVWFVGDTLEEDIAGALATGMVAVWFNPLRVARPSSAPEPHHEVESWAELIELLRIA